jgi:hypothetical protein
MKGHTRNSNVNVNHLGDFNVFVHYFIVIYIIPLCKNNLAILKIGIHLYFLFSVVTIL